MCDTVTDGGGWTIFQRRYSGAVDFNRSWDEYKEGFGDYGSGDFYLGNDNIHCLSSSKLYNTRIDISYQGASYAYVYPNFKLFGESDKYKFSFSGYTGPRPEVNAYFNNAPFSTYDQDNDGTPSVSCDKATGSGWWHKDCFFNNLNGKFGGKTGSGIYWYLLTNYADSLDFTEMKMKPQ